MLHAKEVISVERVVTSVEFRIPAQPKATRVAAYARVSSGKDAMLHSLSAQVSYYSYLIQQHSDWLYCGVYADEAMTGTKDDREGFQRLLTECRSGNVDVVITKSISRFARNTVTLLETVRELKSLGVDVYFEEPRIHTISAEGELMMTILASYAQEESLSASENQKWRIRKAFEQGELIQLRFLFGYRITQDKIEIDPDNAAIVREVYQRVIDGDSFGSIARDLNDRGVDRKFGGEWTGTRIRDMVANEKYIGNSLLQKKYRNNHLEKKLIPNQGTLPMYYSEGTHDAIIDSGTFQKAQAVLKRLDEESSGRKPQERSVFTGMIRCSRCGKSYKRVNNHGRLGYNCSTYQRKGKQACSGKSIPETTLIAESTAALGLSSFEESIFKDRIDHIEVLEPNHMLFVFKDRHTIERVWKDYSRAESWTPEMKEAARRRTLSQRRTSK
jgi:DNA invertase Pin-like site-specific DNA recombinase